MFSVFIVGTAGAGKSVLTSTLASWLEANEIKTVKVNLDPAVEKLPYVPDVDVRDYVTAYELMENHDLGPNGAIVAAVDMLASKAEHLKEEILDLKPGYVLFDTPGQMELFAFRSVGEYIVSILGGERKAMLFLVDAALSIRPSGLLSSMLLAASAHYRLSIPQINVLNKIDLIDRSIVNKIMEWVEDLDVFYNDLVKEKGTLKNINEMIFMAVREFISAFNIIPVSALTGENIEQIYITLQQIYTGGEDYIYLSS